MRGILVEMKQTGARVPWTWEWHSLKELWDWALEEHRFRLRRGGFITEQSGPLDTEIYCSASHFVRFVFSGLILNTLDAFVARPSREKRRLGIVVTTHKDELVIRYFDSAGGIRVDQVKSVARSRAAWRDLSIEQIIFEQGFSTKGEEASGTGGGYGLYLVRSTLRQHNGNIELVNLGEPGAVFEIKLPDTHVRQRGRR